MRICPKCRSTFPTSDRFCPSDASILVEQADIDRIGQTVGNYHLLSILGRGGMGTVYAGEHVYIGKRVAVKVLHPRFAKYEDAVKRFLREARAASSINHPNIVDVTDFGPLNDGGVFFTMEYLEGSSLEDVIDKNGALPLHRALNVANQLALALAAAHDKGIIHRDLKPDNIMLIPRPGRRDLIRMVAPAPSDPGASRFVIEKEEMYDFVKILDFGIAKVLNRDETSPSQTLAGAVFGTPEYMSPEAARGDEVDLRSDVYSVGVILFDMCTGRPPFEAEAAAEVLAMHINKPPPNARDFAPELEVTEGTAQLIYRAMQKDPNARHQNMDEFRDELQNCYGSIAFKRHAHSIPAAGAKRKKGLTEELDEWLHSNERLSLDEARQAAMVELAAGTFDRRTGRPVEGKKD